MARESQEKRATMIEYPLPILKMTPKQALTIICQTCHTEAVIDADDILNDDCYECPANTAAGERRCEGWACMKYWEGDTCPGCGTLGFYGGLNDPLKGACSRACMLQAEYKETLEANRA